MTRSGSCSDPRHRPTRDDQPELAVLVEGGVGEGLRADEDLRVGGAVVGLDYLAVDVEAGRGAVVADPDPGPGQLANALSYSPLSFSPQTWASTPRLAALMSAFSTVRSPISSL